MESVAKMRDALLKDLPRIVEIHSDIILEGGLTADLEPYSLSERATWFELTSKHPYFIALLEVGEEIAGYVYTSPWRNGRGALCHVAEVSYFLAQPYRGNGYGRLMLQESMRSAAQSGFKTMLAILLDSNTASVSLLESEGFKIAGHLPGIVELDDRVSGQFIMIKNING